MPLDFLGQFLGRTLRIVLGLAWLGLEVGISLGWIVDIEEVELTESRLVQVVVDVGCNISSGDTHGGVQ